MNISSVSSLSYYNTSSLKGKVTSQSTTDETTEEFKVGGKKKPPEGMPPGPPPSEAQNLDTNSDGSWDSDELSAYASFSTNELGVELDAESILTEYDTDEDGSLNESEISSLMENNALKLPPKPPKHNKPEEQAEMMAQMQATTSLSASTINIADYITEEEEEEDNTISSLTSTSTDTIDITDYIVATEEDEEDSATTSTTVETTSFSQKLTQRLLENYSNNLAYEEESSAVFFAS